jgi:maltose O-acetyltransferase
MTSVQHQTLTFTKPPQKNYLILGLLYLKFPLWFRPIKWIIKKDLKHSKDVDFTAGLIYFYGNIYANNAFLCDAFLIDYADIVFEEESKVSFNCMFITAKHNKDNFKIITAEPIIIKKNVFIGSRSIVLGGVTIGENSIIGAGSVVTKDIPPNVLAGGNPCKVIKSL